LIATVAPFLDAVDPNVQQNIVMQEDGAIVHWSCAAQACKEDNGIVSRATDS
jgi:hypothetical protein